MSTDGRQTREFESGHDYVNLYVRTDDGETDGEGTDDGETDGGELLYAVYEAGGLEIPVAGDRISLLEAGLAGDVDGPVEYREEDEPTTYVVERREIDYLAVDYDVEGFDRCRGVVSEVTLRVRETDGGNE